MSKYIIDIPNVIEWGVVTCRTEDEFYTRDFDSLDELNSDYINEHFGDLQDTAYQKGFEDGKKEAESSETIEQAKADAFNKGMLFKEEKIHEAYQRGFEDGKWKSVDGCTGCKYEGKTGEHLPCDYCMNNFKNQWTAKDDEIEVGDEVAFHHDDGRPDTVVVVTYIGQDGFIDGMDGRGTQYAHKNPTKWTKTGRHFDIASILEDMRND